MKKSRPHWNWQSESLRNARRNVTPQTEDERQGVTWLGRALGGSGSCRQQGRSSRLNWWHSTPSARPYSCSVNSGPNCLGLPDLLWSQSCIWIPTRRVPAVSCPLANMLPRSKLSLRALSRIRKSQLVQIRQVSVLAPHLPPLPPRTEWPQLFPRPVGRAADGLTRQWLHNETRQMKCLQQFGLADTEGPAKTVIELYGGTCSLAHPPRTKPVLQS